MKLQILVPQYNETEEVIKPLLDSLALQQNVNFKEDIGVIIANDGGDYILSNDFLNSYPYEIKYIQCEHRGVSATRNACLDEATADYVMFCDIDDMFFNMCGVWIIFKEIENSGFDSLTSIFVEEGRIPGTNEITYMNREQDGTFVHGKIHKRKYLLEKNIRWNDNLTVHEDSYFNLLCQNCSQKVMYCITPFYLWKWRDESVCRRDPKYILKTFVNMLASNDALIDQFITRGMVDKASFYTCFMVFDAYYLMNKPEWIDQENQEYRENTEKEFAKYFKKYKRFWIETPEQDKMIISNGVRQRQVMEGMGMEKQTISTWLEHIEELID